MYNSTISALIESILLLTKKLKEVTNPDEMLIISQAISNLANAQYIIS